MKIIKCTLLLLFFQGSCQFVKAKECNYSYDVGSLIMWKKDLKRNVEQNQNAEETLLKLQSCIDRTSNNLELGFLYHRLAQQQFSINVLDESVIENAVKSFEAYPEEICQEYITLHLYHEEDPSFVMHKHFLDILDDKRLTPIRSHCIDNYKQAKIDKRNAINALRKAEMLSPTIIQAYADDLRKIEKNDQRERRKSYVDWDVQNKLDAKNRIRLDNLFEKYGFPSLELVGSELSQSAFMVLHHSSNCDWNKKWIPRFVEYDQVNEYGQIFNFFFYRNFNEKNGQCRNDKEEVKSLFTPEYEDKIKDLMDFSHWEKVYEKK